MNSCLLYHGPDVESAVLQKAESIGRVLASFGKEGLKVDDARQIISLLGTKPVGDKKGVVLIGPMELANVKASDVLLKSIEETNDFVQPVLWANDIGGVVSTIRSRCISIWVPSVKEVPESWVKIGREIIDACLNQQYYLIPKLIEKSEMKEVILLEVFAYVLANAFDEKSRQLWKSLRSVCKYTNPTKVEILSALVGG
jgi:hypothetical protein